MQETSASYVAFNAVRYVHSSHSIHCTFSSFCILLYFLVPFKSAPIFDIPEIRINGIVRFFYIPRHLHSRTINTNGLVNQISRRNFAKLSSFLVQLQKRGRQSSGAGLINQNRPFTFYEKAVTARGPEAERKSPTRISCVARPTQIYSRVFRRTVDSMTRPIGRAHVREPVQAHFGEGTNTRPFGLIGK